jgi:cell division protein FtsW
MIGATPANRRRQLLDIPLIASVFALAFFGLIMIYDASVVAAFRDFGDQLYYFKNQLVWVSLGTVALFAFSIIDYHKIVKIAPAFLAVALVFLILVLIPHIGTKVYGARRWISVSGFTFQPSELAKLALIAYQAYIMSKFQNYKIRFFDIIYVLFLPISLLTGLVLLEPDLGTALIFAGISTTMYFVGGGAIWHFMLMIPAAVAAAAAAIISQPYRIARLKSFIDPAFDPQGASYQINQILIALASGGLLGVGIGGSRGKFDFIPEVHSDAIFAVVAEELGFLGALVFVSLLLFLISRGIQIARGAADYEGKIIAAGIVALISIQAFLNLASIVALVPLTGIPLPFISYGGSSLMVTMVAVGILINIKRQS